MSDGDLGGCNRLAKSGPLPRLRVLGMLEVNRIANPSPSMTKPIRFSLPQALLCAHHSIKL